MPWSSLSKLTSDLLHISPGLLADAKLPSLR